MLNYEFPPIGGGTGIACYYTLQEMVRESDLQIDLVTFSPSGTYQIIDHSENIRIHYVDCGKKKHLQHWRAKELARWTIAAIRYCRTLLKTSHYDLCHAWSGWPAGVVAYTLKSKIPYIVALRGSDVPGHTPRTAVIDNLFMRRLSRTVWSKAHCVTTVSNKLQSLARQTLRRDYRVVRNGVDISLFGSSKKTNMSENIRFLYVGRINENKGIMDFLDAVLALKEHLMTNGVSFSVTIIGDGPLNAVMSNFITENQLSDIVTFFGNVSHGKLPEIYFSHDVLVFPSHSDAMSNVVLESIASGLAIISTNTGAAEILHSNGIIVPVKNSVAIKNAMLQLILDRDRLNAMKESSEALRRDMSWGRSCDQYLEIYRSVITSAV